MTLCKIVFVCSLLAAFLSGRKQKPKNKGQRTMGAHAGDAGEKWRMIRKMSLLCAAVAALGFLAGYAQDMDSVLSEEGYLLRQETGEGEYEAELLLEVEGMEEQPFLVVVPEQYLTKAEEEVSLENAVAEIEAEFAGENTSLSDIRNQVVIRTDYQQGLVTAEWSFSNSRLIAEDGTIRESALSEPKEEVRAEVLLVCGDSSAEYEFYFTVSKAEKSREEILYEKINDMISENGKTEGTEILLLPKDVEGHTLVWKDGESDISLQVLFLGGIIVLLFPGLERERKKEAKGKRDAQLLREYPEMINKLTLLLGAGMTLQGAWGRITAQYQEGRRNKQIPRCEVYEEMLITQREIENGKGEVKSYEAFGERCGIPKYRKFSSYLTQNLKKGNRGICEILEKEAIEAFAERKSMAQRYGEEAGTKLLLPMMLMLGIVIVILVIPAVISFQTGLN